MGFLKKYLNLSRIYPNNSFAKEPAVISNMAREYVNAKGEKKKLILCITVGRSGTRWLADIFSAHRNAIGSCERNVTAESFYRYIKWNNLPIDTQGVIEFTKASIIKDWQHADISLVASPYFSHDFIHLFKRLGADKVIWAVNDARFTVTSFYNKGWYSGEVIREDHDLVIGFQPVFQERWSHFFGRLIPAGEFYHEWKSLTRIGKISWFYNTVNMEIYSQVQKMPEEKVWVFKLEEADQNYNYYLKLAKEFGLEPILSKKKFLSLKRKSVKKTDNICKEWSAREQQEFTKYTSEFRENYGDL